MADWMRARCLLRTKDVPREVTDWLDGQNADSAPATEHTKPNAAVLGWVTATIDDPGWPQG
jgi:hypothetical protein